MYVERSVVLGLVVLGIIALVWRSSMSALERARAAGKLACRRSDVQFLDDSMVRETVRLRLRRGHPPELVRRYQFEFASRGDRRYRGTVTVAGRQPVHVDMEPFASVEQADHHKQLGEKHDTSD